MAAKKNLKKGGGNMAAKKSQKKAAEKWRRKNGGRKTGGGKIWAIFLKQAQKFFFFKFFQFVPCIVNVNPLHRIHKKIQK